jgi:hypothetical protein
MKPIVVTLRKAKQALVNKFRQSFCSIIFRVIS